MVIQRFGVYPVVLRPAVGSEMRETRPCPIVSPGDLNRHIGTVIVAPMTTRGRPYPSRVPCRFDGKDGQVVLDQLRTVDTVRLVKTLGAIEAATQAAVLRVLAEMFAE